MKRLAVLFSILLFVTLLSPPVFAEDKPAYMLNGPKKEKCKDIYEQAHDFCVSQAHSLDDYSLAYVVEDACDSGITQCKNSCQNNLRE